MMLKAMRLSVALLAFLRVSWTMVDSVDEGNLLDHNEFGSCAFTLRPEGPCKQGQDESTCPYLVSVPPLTVHFPNQLRELQKIMEDLQKLKDNVDQLKKMCADCTVRQTERECGRQSEREHENLNVGTERYEDERNWFNERNPESLIDFSQDRVTSRVKAENRPEGNSETDSEKIKFLENKRRNKGEVERKNNKGVITSEKKLHIVDKNGKTQAQRAKGKDKFKQATLPTAGGSERIEDVVIKKVAEKNRERKRERNKAKSEKENPKGAQDNILENTKTKEKTTESDHHAWRGKTKETEIKTQTEEHRGSDGRKQCENHGEHTNKQREQHREERKREMEKGIKVERNNEKPKQSENIGHIEKEKTIKDGEVGEDKETGKEIKTEGEKTVVSVQRDSDRELAYSKVTEGTDFVSISPTPHSAITLSPKRESTDTNKAITFASSLGSSLLSSSSSLDADGLQTQIIGLGAVGISEHSSTDAGTGLSSTNRPTTLDGPVQQTTSATSRFTYTPSGKSGASLQQQVSSTTLTPATTAHQDLYSVTFPGIADNSCCIAKKNMSSNNKTGMKMLPGQGPVSGERHKSTIKPEVDRKIKNSKNGHKPDRTTLPDRKSKHDQKQKSSYHKPITNMKSKPGKDPKHVQIPKYKQRPLPDNLPTDRNIQLPEHGHALTTDQNQLVIQKPKFHQKPTIPVQKSSSHQRPQAVNLTYSDKDHQIDQQPESTEIPIIDHNLKPEKKSVHLKTNKPDQKQKLPKQMKSKEKSKPDQKSILNQHFTPVQEPAQPETTSIAPNHIHKPVTELMEYSDENPSPEPKSVQDSSPGPKPKPNHVLNQPTDQEPIPSQNTLKINHKPERGPTLNLNQTHPNFTTGQKTKLNVKSKPDQKPQTKQELKAPLPNQMPDLTPKPVPNEILEADSHKILRPLTRDRRPTSPTAEPGAQRKKPSLQLKPRSKPKTYLDPPLITGTTPDPSKNTQTDMEPTCRSEKPIADMSHSSRKTEYTSSKMRTLDPMFNNLESEPFTHLHSLPEDFTTSQNSRITSNVKPQTTTPLPSIQMTTRPNRIILAILPSVTPQTSPVPSTAYNIPINSPTLKPEKDPEQVQIPKLEQRTLPDYLPTDRNLQNIQLPKHDHKHMTDENQLAIQKPTIPVQKSSSHQRPQAVNVTDSDKDHQIDKQPESVEIPIIDHNLKPEKKSIRLKTNKPDQKQKLPKQMKIEDKSKPNPKSILKEHLTPVQEPAQPETTSVTPNHIHKPVTELTDNTENLSPEPKSVQDSSPGHKPKPNHVLNKVPDQKTKPSQDIPKINPKPERGPTPNLNQTHPNLTRGQKTKLNMKSKPDQTPQTNQELEAPLPNQMPVLTPKPVPNEILKAESNKISKPLPRHRTPNSPTAEPGAQRKKTSLQLKLRSKAKTDLDPPLITRTTPDTSENSQTDIPHGFLKTVADLTHSSGETEFSSSEIITQDPKTFNSLNSDPFPHFHSLPKDFTMNQNSRISSDLNPQTATPPPSIQMTTRPNRIMLAILPSVTPHTSPRPTKPKQVSGSDSRSQVNLGHNVEETTHRQISDPNKMIQVSSPRFQTISTTGPDLTLTNPATSGPKPLAPQVSTASARKLRVKFNQVVAFLNNSLGPNGRHAESHRTEHSDDKRNSSRPDGKLLTLTPFKAIVMKRDCSDYLLRGETKSGVYLVTPSLRSRSFRVFCDMELNGGGWTILQRRQDGSVSFNRTWAEYRSGFGELNGGEFWLGNNMIHLLTWSKDMLLRVELEDFDGEMEYAEYSQFRVASERMRYRLTVGGYSGTAGDALRFSKTYDHGNRAFTTPDRDHDRYPSGNCGAYYSSGWWFDACMAANLNGRYYVGKYKGVRDGIFWGTWHKISTENYPTNERQSFKSVRMMIRPRSFKP